VHPQSSSARRIAAGVLIATLGLGAVACGGTASRATAQPTAIPTGGARYLRISRYLDAASPQERLAFTQCMRKNGLPDFPSTLSLAALQAAGINVRSASFRSAARTCKSALLG